MAEKTRSLAEMDHAHRRVARYVGIALIVGEPQQWIYLKTILQGLLMPRERAALAFAATRSFDQNDRTKIATNAIPQWAALSAPLPTFLDVANDARWWAENASPKEIEAYLLACFNALQRHRHIEFGQYIQTRIAA